MLNLELKAHTAASVRKIQTWSLNHFSGRGEKYLLVLKVYSLPVETLDTQLMTLKKYFKSLFFITFSSNIYENICNCNFKKIFYLIKIKSGSLYECWYSMWFLLLNISDGSSSLTQNFGEIVVAPIIITTSLTSQPDECNCNVNWLDIFSIVSNNFFVEQKFLSVGLYLVWSWLKVSQENGICCFWYKIYFINSVMIFEHELLVRGFSRPTVIEISLRFFSLENIFNFSLIL